MRWRIDVFFIWEPTIKQQRKPRKKERKKRKYNQNNKNDSTGASNINEERKRPSWQHRLRLWANATQSGDLALLSSPLPLPPLPPPSPHASLFVTP